MVFPAASPLTASCFQFAPSKERFCPLQSSFPVNLHRHVSVTCSAKVPSMQRFPDSTKFIAFFNHTKDRLQESIPDSVKKFPWKNAEKVALHKLQVLAKETLKWALLAYFALSCPSDISYSISRNKELVIPLGLFVGCNMANYFDDISSEFMSDHEGDVFTWKLLGLSCFFVLVKVFSVYLLGANEFLLHISNGGLMQLLWNWKKSSSEDAATMAKTDE